MRVRALTDITYNEVDYKEGDYIDAPDDDAEKMIQQGIAEDTETDEDED
jgi:hypothetical protein